MANVLSTEKKLERANEALKDANSEIKQLKDERRGKNYELARKDKEIEELKNKYAALEGEKIEVTVERDSLAEEIAELRKENTRLKSHPAEAREKEYNFILKWRTRGGQIQSRAEIDNWINLKRDLPDIAHLIKSDSSDLDIQSCFDVLVGVLKMNGLTLARPYHKPVDGELPIAGMPLIQHTVYYHYVGSVEGCGIMKRTVGAFIDHLRLNYYIELVVEENTPLANKTEE